ncbi:hypothetical protein KQI58_07100 [Enterococcus raffinosus]|uniref:SpaA isopeptide-forming pilin-related protein n=1 Tax=Enterococcus raffinosus TaxID=71452 RepID=UPI001C114B2A|nr:SpaA isopeptide-forming pilin-related protein [Enterococcus raffinosus]MBU5360844.1 hypothetical protein [Enterococcus raffinosus]
MQKTRLIKKIAIVLPIIFLLGVAAFLAAPYGGLLKADDTAHTVVKIYHDKDDITDGSFQTKESSVVLDIKSDENQLVQFSELDFLAVSSKQEDLSVKQVTEADFNAKEILATIEESKEESSDKTIKDELFQVVNDEGKVTGSYLQIVKGSTVKLLFEKKVSGNIEALLTSVKESKKQKLFQFTEKKKTKEDINLPTYEEIEKKNFTAKDSFKPIAFRGEIPDLAKETFKSTKSSPAVKVTGLHLSELDGTPDKSGKFDPDNSPGYDKDQTNKIVRSYDSLTYKLAFSMESTDPTTNYTNIKYRVDMELPDAYTIDGSGEERFNAAVMSGMDDFGELIDDTASSKKSVGYVEDVLREPGNSNIIIPMIVNVFGAKHGHTLQPKIKLTIISAENEKTGEIVTIDKEYTSSDPETAALATSVMTVSAKASITPTLYSGGKIAHNAFLKGTSAKDENWDAIGLGVTLTLNPLSGRDSDDFRGSTFPSGPVTYQIDSNSSYLPDGLMVKPPATEVTRIPVPIGTGMYDPKPVVPIAHSPATTSQTPTDWNWIKYNSAGNSLAFTASLIDMAIPKGNSGKIYTEEPSSSIDKKQVGVYKTGNNVMATSGDSFTVTNTGYSPLHNPYTYTMRGGKIGANQKIFSSTSMVVEWSKEHLAGRAAGGYETTINISSISYEGNTYSTDSKQTFYAGKEISGAYVTGVGVVRIPEGETPKAYDSAGSTHRAMKGDGKIEPGASDVYLGNIAYANPLEVRKVFTYLRWNPKSFKYDKSRELQLDPETTAGYVDKAQTEYGVKKSAGTPITLTRHTRSSLESEYDWFPTVAAAQSHGDIGAVKVVSIKAAESDYSFMFRAPVQVIGKSGATDSSGNPHVLTMDSYSYDKDDKLLNQYPNIGDTYYPSTFDSDGNLVTSHTGDGYHGDTIFIKELGIETTTAPKKKIYKTNEKVKWKVTGEIHSNTDKEHTIRLTTTLPNGLSYDDGSAVDNFGNKPDPSDPSTTIKETVTVNPDGTTTIVWELTGRNPTKGHLAEVEFTTSPVLKNLTFNSALVAEQTVKTVGEIWLTEDPSRRDDKDEEFRSSSGKVQLTQSQQVILKKSVDKEEIEVGDNDPANPSLSTDITYTLNLTNNSSEKLLEMKLLDVLPYNGDDYGSHFTGDYTIKKVEIVKGDATIHYLETIPSKLERTNPKDITLSSWSTYKPGVDSATKIKDAKAFVFQKDEMLIEEKLTVKITISPIGQVAGDLYKNRASMNTKLDLPIKSNEVETTVYSRDLSGYVWYDDDYDGLIGNKSDGSPEDPVGDIEVKLYRTSLENPSYTDKLVKEDLLGNSLIDGSGNSTIKTDVNGKYKFENLPEGEYVAEFVVGDLVLVKKIVIVTKKEVGSDPSKNSKADPSDFKTDKYTQHELKDLPKECDPGDNVFHVNHVNAGLTRLSKIRLFKYEEGTVIDANNDGTLSAAEIEAVTTHALAGAEFQLYKGNSTADADKIGTPVKTGADGWLEFGGLPPGDYTIVETKAPDGFELLKEPIKVTVPTYNFIAIVHVPDKGQTKLPFTGGTKALRIILIAAAALFVTGMAGVFLHFRPIKVKGGK